MWKAFLTGSRRYGTPKPESDFDLCIRMSREELSGIVGANIADTVIQYDDSPTASLKFGNLNMIVCLTDAAFEKWASCSAILEARAPVTRDEAIQIHKKAGISGYGYETGRIPSLRPTLITPRSEDPDDDFPF